MREEERENGGVCVTVCESGFVTKASSNSSTWQSEEGWLLTEQPSRPLFPAATAMNMPALRTTRRIC